LIQIIQKRLGANISLVDEPAIVFASRRIAKSKGDAREALQLMNDAIIKATESLSSEELSRKGTQSPVVKIPHVMKAIKETGVPSIVKIIEDLPQNAKVVLCVATTLGQVSSAWKIISLSNLKNYCGHAHGHGSFESWSQDMFNDTIEQLSDAGLIKYEDSDDIYDNSGDKSIQVGVQLEDVELAVNDSLIKENTFYKGLVEWVREHDIEQVR